MVERAHPEHPGFKNRWFGLKKNKYRANLQRRYARCNPFIADKVVLDLPCGTGWGTSLLRGYRSAWGVDISADAVEYARKNFERPGRLEFRVGDMQKIPLADDAVDVLLCLEGFEHVEKAVGIAFLDEAKRVLKRNGLLIMTCPILDEQGRDTGNPYHVYEYPEEELIDLLNANFRIHDLERIAGPDGPEYQAILSNIKNTRYGPPF
jgi:ubiquinone/menaquinone biosynthesis C-methylase UbiE